MPSKQQRLRGRDAYALTRNASRKFAKCCHLSICDRGKRCAPLFFDLAMIPLRPELVEFMEPASLCRYSCTSKTLCKDVRDTKAWALLARAQMPCKTRDAVSDALSHVQSQVRRRLLADALSQETPQPQTFRPNRLEDFTYFVRFEEDGRLIWEGDLQCPYEECDNVVLDLRPVWDAIRRARSWIGMERMLTQPTDDDTEGTIATTNFLQRVNITVIAIRDQDEAMVSLGQFVFADQSGSVGEDYQPYDFRSRTALFSSARFNLRMMATLEAVHNAEGHGCLHELVLRLYHYSEEAVGEYRPDGHVDTCDESQFAYVLSYLAGIHHLARAHALATIENWHVEARQQHPHWFV